MGGTAPICPFCRKKCASGGVKDHVKAKHPDKYREWINFGQLPYWHYDENGNLKRNEEQWEAGRVEGNKWVVRDSGYPLGAYLLLLAD